VLRSLTKNVPSFIEYIGEEQGIGFAGNWTLTANAVIRANYGAMSGVASDPTLTLAFVV
jgi:hypothetical protein